MKPTTRSWLPRRVGDRGGSVVEMAILWPVIVLALFASPQIVAYYTARNLALTAAQAAVTAERQLDAQPGSGKAHAQQLLAEAGDWLDPPPGGDQVSDPAYTDTGISYTVRGTAITLVPGITWQVSQAAHGTLEELTRPQDGGAP